MQAAINYAIGLIKSYTNANIQYAGTNGADIMTNPTSYAYYPGNYAVGGDIWFGTQYDCTQAKLEITISPPRCTSSATPSASSTARRRAAQPTSRC